MKLGIKLITPQLVVLLLIMAAALMQTLLIREERRTLERATGELEKVAAQIQRLSQLFSESERDVLGHLMTPGAVTNERLYATQSEAAQLLQEVARTDWTPRGTALCEDLQLAYGRLSEAQLRVMEKKDATSVRHSFVRWWFLAQRADAMLADLSAYNMRRLNRALGEVGVARRRFGNATLLLTLTAALFAIGFAVWVIRHVLRPIALLTSASQRVGEPGQSVPRMRERHDEIGVLASTLADTTERLTRSKAELEDALKARDQFLSIAAHELKTPLTSLQLQLELLKRKLGTAMEEDQVSRSVGSLDRQVFRIKQLVAELLDVARIQAGRLELHVERVWLAPEIEEVAARCHELLSQAGCSLTLALDATVMAKIDRSRFEQLLVNLLANVAKYAPHAPVDVSLVQDADRAVLRVKDHGPGIAEEVRPLLFQRFARLASFSATGLGLGLFISRQIAEAHQGTLEATSVRGQGTEFVLRLPAA